MVYQVDLDMSADRYSPGNSNGQSVQDDCSRTEPRESAPVDDRAPGGSVEPDAFKQLFKQLQELGEYFSYYAAARTDSFKLSLRRTVLWMAFAALGFVAVGGLLLSSTWLLLIGLAEGLSVLFGDRPWVGNLLAGALLLLSLVGGMYGMMVALDNAARKKAVKAYGERQARQEERYGHHVTERAATASSRS